MSREKPLEEVLKRFVKSLRIEGKLNEVKLKEKWTLIVGQMISDHTTELRFYGKKLFVTIDSAPLRQELSYSKAQLLKNVQEAFPSMVVEEIVFR